MQKSLHLLKPLRSSLYNKVDIVYFGAKRLVSLWSLHKTTAISCAQVCVCMCMCVLKARGSHLQEEKEWRKSTLQIPLKCKKNTSSPLRATRERKTTHSAPKLFPSACRENFLSLLFCFDFATSSQKGGKTSLLSLTGATLYLLDPRTGRQSVLGRHCSAKTQQHTIREVHILTGVGSRGGALAGWFWRSCVRCAKPGVTRLQGPGRLLFK